MKLPKELLYKLSEGRCTPDEKKAIEEWMGDGEWDLNEDEIRPDIKDSIWQKLNRNISFPSQVVPITRRYQFLKIAAVLIMIFAGIALFYVIKKDTSSTQQVYATNAHEQKRILLSDSSVVFLSPNSTLQVTQPFPDHKRDIELSGEAFFEVAKDASKPFTVITNNIRTTALGTSFKVTSFPNKDHISIALSYGKVLVQNHRSNAVTDSFYLAPGEAIEYDKINKKIEKTKIVEKQLSYKNSILYFKEAGIKEVVNKLQEFYHIKVEYGALKNAEWRVSGEFDYQPLEIVMENISFSCNISYKIIGNTLILKPAKTTRTRDEY
jgi:ferric-dicitrate binding protein FerR (iron transport regulator)